ncbi:hypothetical protein Rcae01_03636 [Novipirellula caenicola]|uniref:Uncharacterized protein n=1 Tax=Novipirellula caenicola TaxID=1536901 RepID=A0ABP9VSR4_9BACT
MGGHRQRFANKVNGNAGMHSRVEFVLAWRSGSRQEFRSVPLPFLAKLTHELRTRHALPHGEKMRIDISWIAVAAGVRWSCEAA